MNIRRCVATGRGAAVGDWWESTLQPLTEGDDDDLGLMILQQSVNNLFIYMKETLLIFIIHRYCV